MSETKNDEPPRDAVIHYSHQAQQPDVELACGRSTTPAWSDEPTGHDDVYPRVPSILK